MGGCRIRPFGTCCVCVGPSVSARPGSLSTRRAGSSDALRARPSVQPCRAGSSVTACPGPSLGLAAQGCPSTRRADRSFNRAAWGRSSASSREEYPLPRRGPVSTCYAGYLLCWAVSARPDSPLSSCRAGPSAQGSLNAPDWLAGQHADRAWPTRRRGIRMPWWCWPVGRSPCCSPRQWPPGNESPCLIPRQR